MDFEIFGKDIKFIGVLVFTHNPVCPANAGLYLCWDPLFQQERWVPARMNFVNHNLRIENRLRLQIMFDLLNMAFLIFEMKGVKIGTENY
jgi:hypothetical protein